MAEKLSETQAERRRATDMTNAICLPAPFSLRWGFKFLFNQDIPMGLMFELIRELMDIYHPTKFGQNLIVNSLARASRTSF